MNKKLLYIICMILIFSNLVITITPSTNIQFSSEEDGFDIEYPKLNVIQQNKNFSFNFHIFNKSNGVIIINNLSCLLYITNNTDGKYIANEFLNATYSGSNIYRFEIDEGNFTQIGDSSFMVYCNDSNFGSFISIPFTITESGAEITEAQSTIYSMLIIISLIIMVILIFFAWNIDGKNKYDVGGGLIMVNFNKYIKAGLWLLSYLALIFVVFFSWKITQFLSLEYMSVIFKWLFIVLMTLAGPLIIVTFVLMLTKWLLDTKIWKLGRRGLKPR